MHKVVQNVSPSIIRSKQHPKFKYHENKNSNLEVYAKITNINLENLLYPNILPLSQTITLGFPASLTFSVQFTMT